MNRRGTHSSGPDGRRDSAPLEDLRRFIAARFVLAPHRPTNAARRAGATSRPSAFSREVVDKHERPTTADTSGFLRLLFARRAVAGELPGYRSGLVYREPGTSVQQSFHTWLLESVLSLTVNKLEQRFGVWLTHTPATAPAPVRESGSAARPGVQTPGQVVFLSRPAHDAGSPSAVERGLPAVYARDAARPGAQGFQLQTLRPLTLVNTLRMFERGAGDSPKTAGSLAAAGRSVGADARPAEAVGRAWTRAYAVSPNSAPFGLDALRSWAGAYLADALRAFESRMRDGSESAAPVRPRDAALKIKQVYAAGWHNAFAAEFASRATGINTGAEAWAATHPHLFPSTRFVTLQPSGGRPGRVGTFQSATAAPGNPSGWLEQRRAALISFAKVERPAAGLLRVADGAGENADATALRREPAAGGVRAYEPAAGAGFGGARGVLTFVRREEQLRPPTQSYALARPTPPAAAVDEPASVRAQSKEVTEVVRKEVETAMKSRSPIDGLTRSDYTRIADHVYTSLARRLLIDKERSGLRR